MRIVAVKVPERMLERAARVSKHRRISRSALFREALRRYLTEESEPLTPSPGSFVQVARKYVGCVSGGPSDLSWNPKHLIGFGKE